MLKNIGSNWIVTLVTVAVTYVLTPFLIHTLGMDGYGTWTLIISITGYLSLLVLGVPMASVRYFAEHSASGDRKKMNEAIGSCTGLYLLMGAAALVIGAAIFFLFDLSYEVPSAWRSDARIAFGFVVVYISLGFVGILPEGIMAARQDFVARNFIVLTVLLLRLGLTIVLLRLIPSLVVLAGIQLICLILDFSTSWFVIRHRDEGLRISLAEFDWGMVRRIFSFSMYVLMLNVGGRLSFQTGSIVIGAYLDVSDIPFYSVANSFLVYLMDFIVAIAAVLMPMATKLQTEGRSADLREIFLKWSKIAISLTLLVALYLLVLGPRFIGWWIAPAFEGPAGLVLQILMVSSIVFMPIRGVAQPILMGLGKVGLSTVAFLSAGVLNLILSLVLVWPLGLQGVAIATAIPNVLFGLVMLIFTCRQMQIPVLAYIRYVGIRAFLGAIPVLAMLLWFRYGLGVHSLFGLVGAGLSMLFIFGLIWVFFVYRNDPYVNVTTGLSRVFPWGRS